MSLSRKKNWDITVEYITGRGVKTTRTTFTKSPVMKNVYNVQIGPSEIIRVTVVEK